jgi:large subunit ribosomal protein L35
LNDDCSIREPNCLAGKRCPEQGDKESLYQVLRPEQIGDQPYMPKMKTHKSTAKRFKVTGTGKLLRLKQRRSHLRRKKSKRILRSYRKDLPLSQASGKRVRRILGLPNRKRK